MPNSGSDKIRKDKARKPRSHQKMVVFTFGAQKEMELPFIVGVMSDLSGKSKVEKKPISERDYLEIDSGNFGTRMRAIKPRVNYRVPNQMSKDGGEISVDLEFESMDDFKPDVLARKIEPLRNLLEQRDKLQNLKAGVDGKEKAEQLLEDILKKVDSLK